MLKVLIADDEPIIREGLKTIIQWKEYGFDICGEAVNGEDGFKKVTQLKPDVIIVDIKMPGMNGLDMISKLKQNGMDCKVIILSGYSDFLFAQKALEYDVEYYLLKPIDRLKLIEKVKSIHSSIMKEKMEKEYLNKSIAISRDKILENIVCGEKSNYLAEKFKEQYGFDFSWDYYQVILIEPDGKTEIENQLKLVVKKEIGEYINDNNLGVVFSIGTNLAILSKNRMLELNTGHFEEINNIYIKVCNSNAIITMGESVQNLNDIAISYRHAYGLMRRKFIYGPCKVISGNNEVKKHNKNTLNKDIQEEIERVRKNLCMAIEVSSIDGINELMGKIKYSYENSDFNEEMIKIGYIYIYVGVINKLMSNNEEFKGLLDIKGNVFYEILNKKNLVELHEYVKHKLISISDELTRIRPGIIMDRILEYIYRNCGDNIKLETLACVFNYNSAYLGKLFKNHTGEYFNTYLDMVRIKKAKQFLNEGLKVYQVAKKVGYEDVRYFHRKFKKYTGITPGAFKAKGLSSNL